jgi:hypothetical protein
VAAGAAAGAAAGGVLGGMLRKLSSKKGAKEAAAAEEAAAAAAAAEAVAAAAATQGEAPSSQLTPRPSTDSGAVQQQQREGLAMPSPRPRGSMELLPEDMPDVVKVTPAGGGPPVPMVPLSMPENVQASGKWRGDAAVAE